MDSVLGHPACPADAVFVRATREVDVVERRVACSPSPQQSLVKCIIVLPTFSHQFKLLG
jgi:hypothetical protein